MYLAYTYFVRNKITNQFYYGSRYHNVKRKRTPEEDLWIHYFTSSGEIKRLIEEHGKDSFEFSILMESDDYNKCYWFEQDLIKENVGSSACLNINYVDKDSGKHMFSMAGKKRSKEANNRSSQSNIKYRKNEPPEFRAARIERQKNTWNNRSIDAETTRITKMLNSCNNKSIEEKLIVTENRRSAQNNRTPAEKELSVKKQKLTKAQWTSEQRAEFIAKIKASPNKGKTYVITDPTGDTFTIMNLRQFCKDKGLPYDSMKGISKGTQKYCKNYPGWRAVISD